MNAEVISNVYISATCPSFTDILPMGEKLYWLKIPNMYMWKVPI